jgi:hypothetical protein
MTGRDNPKLRTRSDIYDLLSGVRERLPEIKTEKLDAKEADATGETFVEATLQQDKTNLANWTNIVDSKMVDNRDEFDQNNEFSPEQTGWYNIKAKARITPVSGGDLIQLRVAESDGTSLEELDGKEVGGADDFTFVSSSVSVQLYKSNKYAVEARSPNNGYGIESANEATKLIVQKCFVHP